MASRGARLIKAPHDMLRVRFSCTVGGWVGAVIGQAGGHLYLQPPPPPPPHTHTLTVLKHVTAPQIFPWTVGACPAASIYTLVMHPSHPVPCASLLHWSHPCCFHARPCLACSTLCHPHPLSSNIANQAKGPKPKGVPTPSPPKTKVPKIRVGLDSPLTRMTEDKKGDS